jgi:hypothetical protein
MISNGVSSSPEQIIGFLAILGLIFGAVFACYRWLLAGPRTPDPWGADVEQAVEDGEAVPLCPHCLTPQEHNGWFCPECGSSVGPYVNYLPSVCIFSIGEAVRGGVELRSRWTPLLMLGYVLIAIAFFKGLAPFYCLFLFMNRARARSLQQVTEPEKSEV